MRKWRESLALLGRDPAQFWKNVGAEWARLHAEATPPAKKLPFHPRPPAR